VAEPAGQATGPATGAEARGRDEVEVVLTGGPNAGTHRAPVDLACLGADGNWTVGTGYIRHLPSGIGEIGAVLQGVPASGGSTERIDFLVLFGETDDADPLRGMTGIGGIFGGSGRGTVERQGESAVIRVEGTTGDGTGISATFRCTMAMTA
nr:hypothetical protein [Chloroflexota bacterium]